MPTATLVKDVGHISALECMSQKSLHAYPVEYDGGSTHLGSNDDQLTLHYTGSPNLTAANAILSAIGLPTCTHILLAVTINIGTYLINDVTNIVADPDNEKFIKMVIAINNTTGDLEVYALEKSDEVYPEVPAGSTLCSPIKEYSLAAAGTELVEITDFIK